jgi:hypothetical protein
MVVYEAQLLHYGGLDNGVLQFAKRVSDVEVFLQVLIFDLLQLFL